MKINIFKLNTKKTLQFGGLHNLLLKEIKHAMHGFQLQLEQLL
jgi:hypothetical protein